MSPKNLRCLPLAAAAMVVCMSAQAEYTFADGKLRLSGFGTVGVSRTNNDQAFFNYPGQGGGADRSASFDPDTKLGLQGTYKFTDTLSATAQLLTKYRATGEYKPEFEWAFAKWQATPDFSVRLGRIGSPYFMVSDYRDVGYANTAIRPPLDVYGQVPLSSVDGGDISYQSNMGGINLTSTLWGGQTRGKYTLIQRNSGVDVDPVNIKMRSQIGLNFLAEFDGGYALRMGHSQGKVSLASSSVDAISSGLAGMTAGDPAMSALANEMVGAITTKGEKFTFTGLGVSMDRDNIVLSAEYAWRRFNNAVVADTTGWYALGGLRLGSFLPYVVFSRLKVDDLNAKLNPQAVALGTAYQSVQGVINVGKVVQNTQSVGARWDVRRGMALKAQFDRVNKPAGSNGLFLVPDASTASGQDFFNNKKKVNVLSLAVDFVF